jgi:integrase
MTAKPKAVVLTMPGPAKEKRERGEGHLYLRGKVYWAKFYDRGRPIRMSTGQTEETKARTFLRAKLHAIAADAFVDDRKLRYEDLKKMYLSDYQVHERKSLRVNQKGQVSLDQVNRLELFFRGRKVSSISTRVLREYIINQRNQGYSNGSINRSLSALRHMFHLAKDEERLVKIPKFDLLQESAPRKGCFRRPDYAAVAVHLPKELQLPVALGFFTGARLAEITGLTWAYTDDQHGWVDMQHRVIHLLKTKNGEPRDLPIYGPLVPLLEERYAAAQRSKCPFVCFRITARGKRRGKYERIQTFRKAFTSACEQAGLGKRLFHDLRRSAVKAMIEAGLPQLQAMRISGHESASVFKRYADIFNEAEMQNAAEKLENYHSQPLPLNTVTTTVTNDK